MLDGRELYVDMISWVNITAVHDATTHKEVQLSDELRTTIAAEIDAEIDRLASDDFVGQWDLYKPLIDDHE
jgi:hypothetical protein